MLVRDHQHPRAVGEDRAQLGRVEQALDGAVDHEAGARTRRDRRAVAGDRLRGAGRPDRAPASVAVGVGTSTTAGCAPSWRRARDRRVDQLAPARRLRTARPRPLRAVTPHAANCVGERRHAGACRALMRRSVVLDQAEPAEPLEAHLDAPRQHRGAAPGIAVEPFERLGLQQRSPAADADRQRGHLGRAVHHGDHRRPRPPQVLRRAGRRPPRRRPRVAAARACS